MHNTEERMNFSLGFHMLDNKTEESVYFKPDGQRFGKTQTVKLNADTEYLCFFTFRPVVQLRKLLINGGLQKFEEKKEGIEDDSQAKTYTAKYCTVGEDVNKKGKRKETRFSLEFKDGVYMTFSVQCKFYKYGEMTHAQWGRKLSTIEFICQSQEGRNYIRVLKESYL